jgi:hypothetical protein
MPHGRHIVSTNTLCKANSMTKRQIIGIFTGINLLFIGAQLYKHTRIVHLEYKTTQAIQSMRMLDHTIEELQQQICAHKNPHSIQKYAQDTLHMQPISLARIQRISS